MSFAKLVARRLCAALLLIINCVNSKNIKLAPIISQTTYEADKLFPEYTMVKIGELQSKQTTTRPNIYTTLFYVQTKLPKTEKQSTTEFVGIKASTQQPKALNSDKNKVKHVYNSKVRFGVKVNLSVVNILNDIYSSVALKDTKVKKLSNEERILKEKNMKLSLQIKHLNERLSTAIPRSAKTSMLPIGTQTTKKVKISNSFLTNEPKSLKKQITLGSHLKIHHKEDSESKSLKKQITLGTHLKMHHEEEDGEFQWEYEDHFHPIDPLTVEEKLKILEPIFVEDDADHVTEDYWNEYFFPESNSIKNEDIKSEKHLHTEETQRKINISGIISDRSAIKCSIDVLIYIITFFIIKIFN